MIKRLIIPIFLLTVIFCQNKALVKKTGIVEDTRTVIATGVGADRDQAVEDGLRNAVEQAIGVYLKSTTIVENYQAIDKLLTHSRGYVKDYDVISERVETPLYRVKLSAVVIVRELKASLLELNLYTKEIEGKSLFAAAMTKVNATQQGMELLEDLFEGYPRNAYVVEYGEPEIKTDETEKVTVYVPYTSKWNMDFIYDLKEILDEIAVDYIQYGDESLNQLKQQYINSKSENSSHRFGGYHYFLNRSIVEYLNKSIVSSPGLNSSTHYSWPKLRTELVDKNGEVIKKRNVGFRKDMGSIIVTERPIPWLKKAQYSSDIEFQLTLAEMNQIVKVDGYATKK